METRALAIALFYAIGTAVGGISGPLLFGQFIHSGHLTQVATGFFIGAGAMALGGIAELLFGVRAEGKSLEAIAEPLSAAEGPEEDAERDDRIAERRDRDRRGMRRFRPGPGRSFNSPGMLGSVGDRRDWHDAAEVQLDREVGAIGDSLREGGPLGRDQIARAVSAGGWGPGRFAAALRAAVGEGLVSRGPAGTFSAIPRNPTGP
jgi:hypothetical protein